jgi:pimeloyl-ACP methyl ester carboxylesterase
MDQNQQQLPRRDFLKSSLVAGAESAAAGVNTASATEASLKEKAITKHSFGKNGLALPILGMGGSPLVAAWSGGGGSRTGSVQERAKLVRHAYDQGVRYVDTARRYFACVGLMAIAAGLCVVPTAHAGDPNDIRPFRIKVADSVLEDLQRRLTATRWPDQVSGTEWQYGVDVGYMKELTEYWQREYDWRKHEEQLNSFAQFKTRVDGLDLHFLHVKSPHDQATPLVLVHGWPGSVYEFYRLIPMLTEPEKHGGDGADAFHVVCPSLPGFGFSEMPKERGWNSQRMAEVIAKLMSRLGYGKYGAQGGDWGGGIVRWMATQDAGHCIGAHSNFPPAHRPRENPMRGVTQSEMERFQRRREELAGQFAYSALQGTRPLTLGYGLNDSPAGLAAWIVDKFWAWSDHRGDLENSFTKDELLTNVMIYWVTETMPSSTRIYFESRQNLPRPSSMSSFEPTGPASPVGFALFPKEINVPPRAWVERSVGDQLIHWTELPCGGHFAALETPELLTQDVRLFFRKVRETSADGDR